MIATPILLVNAFSPAIFALLVDQFGWQISLYALLGCSMVTWIAIELMSRWYEGAQARRARHLATRHDCEQPLGGHPRARHRPKHLLGHRATICRPFLRDRIAEELGMSSTWFFAAFSAALVISALVGPRAGRTVDAIGGREVLAVSNVIIAAGLAALLRPFTADAVGRLARPGPGDGCRSL